MIGKQIVNNVSAYAPQVGLSAEEDDFWDSFIIVLPRIPNQDSIFIGSDLMAMLEEMQTLWWCTWGYGIWYKKR